MEYSKEFKINELLKRSDEYNFTYEVSEDRITVVLDTTPCDKYKRLDEEWEDEGVELIDVIDTFLYGLDQFGWELNDCYLEVVERVECDNNTIVYTCEF